MWFDKRLREEGRPPFDVKALEDEIRDTMSLQTRYYNDDAPKLWTPVTVRHDLAVQITSQPTAEDLGKITAEAVKADHDEMIESLYNLGQELESQVRQIEEVIKLENQKMQADIKELIEQCREQGKLHALKIEAKARDLAESRAVLEELRGKILS
jgi:hypothetical protein